MKQIRKGTFETNSSSTHSICVPREERFMDIPEKLEIDIKDYEFGWEHEKYSSVDEKLAYIVMGITARAYSQGFMESCKEMGQLLETIGKWVKHVEIHGLFFECYEGRSYIEEEDYGYVDHANEMSELLDAVLNDENELKRYLFSKDAFILTGNDNEESDVDIKVSYPYNDYYKGN